MLTLLFALWDSAPYNFTKLLKPTETHWRIRGIPIAIIFDDGIGVDSTLEAAKTNSSSVHSDLFRCGFGINHENLSGSPPPPFLSQVFILTLRQVLYLQLILGSTNCGPV